MPTVTLVKSVTHIPLFDANHSKLAALDTVADEFMALCQQYVTYFCAVNEFFDDHPGHDLVIENLSVAVLVARMFALSSHRARQPPRPADVPLWGVRSRGARRRQCPAARMRRETIR